MPRIHCPCPLRPGAQLSLPASAARHVQVLRMQPGERLSLFDGGLDGGAADLACGGEYEAEILRMGRSDVEVRVLTHLPTERELPRPVHLAVVMPASDRMDWLVEKATELGAASIQPLMGERSVLRLSGERATKKLAHWHSIAVAACEQCGRNRVPPLRPVQALGPWLAAAPAAGASGWLLSFRPDSQPAASRLPTLPGDARPLYLLSGPEGGLSPSEEALALAAGFLPTSLGARVLRAETAPLAVLAAIALTA